MADRVGNGSERRLSKAQALRRLRALGYTDPTPALGGRTCVYLTGPDGHRGLYDPRDLLAQLAWEQAQLTDSELAGNVEGTQHAESQAPVAVDADALAQRGVQHRRRPVPVPRRTGRGVQARGAVMAPRVGAHLGDSQGDIGVTHRETEPQGVSGSGASLKSSERSEKSERTEATMAKREKRENNTPNSEVTDAQVDTPPAPSLPGGPRERLNADTIDASVKAAEAQRDLAPSLATVIASNTAIEKAQEGLREHFVNIYLYFDKYLAWRTVDGFKGIDEAIAAIYDIRDEAGNLDTSDKARIKDLRNFIDYRRRVGARLFGAAGIGTNAGGVPTQNPKSTDEKLTAYLEKTAGKAGADALYTGLALLFAAARVKMSRQQFYTFSLTVESAFTARGDAEGWFASEAPVAPTTWEQASETTEAPAA